MRRLLILLPLLYLCGIPDQTAAQHSGGKTTPTVSIHSTPSAANNRFAFPVQNVAEFYVANFGEMRATHFHAGVDIRTDGVEGRPVAAVADGYISRVTLTPGGFGRALYLTLNDGRTAVYGHLSRFRDDIEQLVDAERRTKQSNSVRMWFAPGQFPARRGDRIAWSGNSGSSMGPHLHFELRDTTGRTLNLVRMGIFQPIDDIPPVIMRLHYIEVDTIRGVPIHAPIKTYNAALVGGGHYRLLHEGPIDAGRKGYFVLEASDRRNGVRNTFGLYRASLAVDGSLRFEYRIDAIPAGYARYSSAAAYYPLKVSSRNEVLRMAQLAGAPDCFYPVAKERGIVRVAEGKTRHIRIEAEDDCGNLSTIEFDVRGTAATFRAKADSAAVVLRTNHTAIVRCGADVTARIPAGALYEPVFCRPALLDSCKSGAGVVTLSPVFRILGAATPLHKKIDVAVRIHIPNSMQKQAALAARAPSGRLSYIGGKYIGGLLTAQTARTGELVVVADTVAPVVRSLFKEGGNLSQTETIRFLASDNFSGISCYSLRIDGKWVPCDQFPMRGSLVHTFAVPANKRRHKAELTVTDANGNTTHWNGTFFR